MKRLFSKTILAAMIVSLVPVQSAQADDPRLDLVVVGATLLCGFIGKMIGDHVCKSYREKAEGQTSGLNMLSQSAQRNFDNVSRNPEDAVPGQDGAWSGVEIQGTLASLSLPNERETRLDLASKIKKLRINPTPANRTAVIQTCNKHRDAIQATAQRNIMYTKFGSPIFGALLGFMYGWLSSN